MSRGGGWRPAVTAGSQGRPHVARVSRAGAETDRWPCKFLMAAGTWGSPPIKEADGGEGSSPTPRWGEGGTLESGQGQHTQRSPAHASPKSR